MTSCVVRNANSFRNTSLRQLCIAIGCVRGLEESKTQAQLTVLPFFSHRMSRSVNVKIVFVSSSFAFSITRITKRSEWQISAPGAIKTNVLFLAKIAPSRVIHARVCCKDTTQRKTNKMASEITFVGDEEIQFLSSVSLPNLRQSLGENFLDSDSEHEDYTSDSGNGSENI